MMAKRLMKSCMRALMKKKKCTTKDACMTDCEARIKQRAAAYKEEADAWKAVKMCGKTKCLKRRSCRYLGWWGRRGCRRANSKCQRGCYKEKKETALSKYRKASNALQKTLIPEVRKCMKKCPKWRRKMTKHRRKMRRKCNQQCWDAYTIDFKA